MAQVTAALRRAGRSVNHTQVLRVLGEESLLCPLKRRFVVHTTDSHHGYHVYPNLLEGMTVEAPDVVWVADLPYLRLAREGLMQEDTKLMRDNRWQSIYLDQV